MNVGIPVNSKDELPASPERRRSPRASIAIPVSLKDIRGGERSLTCDISAHGLFVETAVERPERQYIELEVGLPEHEQVRLAAMVARSNPRGIGLEFFAVESEARNRWQSFLRGLSAEAFAASTDATQPRAPFGGETTEGAERAPFGDEKTVGAQRASMGDERTEGAKAKFEGQSEGAVSEPPDFLVRPKDLNRMWAIYRGELARARLRLESPVPVSIDSEVEVLIAHPLSGAEWMLPGRVEEVWPIEREPPLPPRQLLEIRLVDVTPAVKAGFRSFISSGTLPDEAAPPPRTDPGATRGAPTGPNPDSPLSLEETRGARRFPTTSPAEPERLSRRLPSVMVDLDEEDEAQTDAQLDAEAHVPGGSFFDAEEETTLVEFEASEAPSPQILGSGIPDETPLKVAARDVPEGSNGLGPGGAPPVFAGFFEEVAEEARIAKGQEGRRRRPLRAESVPPVGWELQRATVYGEAPEPSWPNEEARDEPSPDPRPESVVVRPVPPPPPPAPEFRQIEAPPGTPGTFFERVMQSPCGLPAGPQLRRRIADERAGASHQEVSTESPQPELDREIGLARARVVRAPDDPDAHRRLTELLVQRKGSESLEATKCALLRLVELVPEEAEPMAMLAEVHARMGRYGEAARYLESARVRGGDIDADLEAVIERALRR